MRFRAGSRSGLYLPSSWRSSPSPSSSPLLFVLPELDSELILSRGTGNEGAGQLIPDQSTGIIP
jgi:hypothetical protein